MALDVVLLLLCVLGPLTINVFSMVALLDGIENRISGWIVTIIQPLTDFIQCILQVRENHEICLNSNFLYKENNKIDIQIKNV